MTQRMRCAAMSCRKRLRVHYCHGCTASSTTTALPLAVASSVKRQQVEFQVIPAAFRNLFFVAVGKVSASSCRLLVHGSLRPWASNARALRRHHREQRRCRGSCPHSSRFNGLGGTWPQLLRKGVRCFKIDVGIVAQASCAAVSLFGTGPGLGNASDCFSDAGATHAAAWV
jgi:hypothetical protein